jgi:hypothetical protein
MIWNRCPAYKKHGNKPNNTLQIMMLCSSLVRKFGGVKITLLCRFVKMRVGKICAMVGRMWCGEVGKESRDDMFLPLFAEKRF